MTLRTHFNNYGKTSEQNLLESLVIESIQIFGMEILYIPRRRGSFDQLTYSDDQSYFDQAYPIEMYLKNVDGFGGDRVFMSKFDIARRRFELEIGTKEDFLAPREGDLIYFPMNKKLFQILFADNKPFFYQLGNLQMYDITCENFEYSSEKFLTGIPSIDSFQPVNSQNYAIATQDGSYLVDHDGHIIASSGYTETLAEDHGDDNDAIQDEITDDDIIDFEETNPYSERNPY